MRKGRVFRGRWLGRPGYTFSYHFDSRPLGRRVVVQVWDDTGEAEIKAVEGDGRNDEFKVYESRGLVAGWTENSIEKAAAGLGGAHFAKVRS